LESECAQEFFLQLLLKVLSAASVAQRFNELLVYSLTVQIPAVFFQNPLYFQVTGIANEAAKVAHYFLFQSKPNLVENADNLQREVTKLSKL